MDNTVELIDTYGGDETHCMSAWTSTDRNAKHRNTPEHLLKMLAENGHHTPFEKSALHFLVTTDIATHIHMLKHRTGVSINGESARYKELRENKAYIPVDWPTSLQLELERDIRLAQERYRYYLTALSQQGFSRSRAKESARFVLPYANQLTADVMFNFRSFMHFQGLRNDEHAQLEIREVAQKMLELVRETNKFPLSLAAFGY